MAPHDSMAVATSGQAAGHKQPTWKGKVSKQIQLEKDLKRMEGGLGICLTWKLFPKIPTQTHL